MQPERITQPEEIQTVQEWWAAEQAAALEREPEIRPNPRIYITSVVGYQAGRKFGVWISAIKDVGDIDEEINQMLRESPNTSLDTWALGSWEGFCGLDIGRCETLDAIVLLARGLNEHGPAFAAWAKINGLNSTGSLSFRDHYLGTWRSIAHFGGEFATALGFDRFLEYAPQDLDRYIRFDHAALAQDMVHRGEVVMEQEEQALHGFLTPGTARPRKRVVESTSK